MSDRSLLLEARRQPKPVGIRVCENCGRSFKGAASRTLCNSSACRTLRTRRSMKQFERWKEEGEQRNRRLVVRSLVEMATDPEWLTLQRAQAKVNASPELADLIAEQEADRFMNEGKPWERSLNATVKEGAELGDFMSLVGGRFTPDFAGPLCEEMDKRRQVDLWAEETAA